MINKNLLQKEVQHYISDNLNSDISILRMKKSPFKEVSSLEIVQQIQGKKIARSKFPFLLKEEEIIYPPHLNLEQASSESTAKFKQKLISEKKGADLTGGTGIDSYFISEQTEEFYYIEPNPELLETVKHNFSVLKRENCSFINKTAEDFLSENSSHFDFVYLDPSRRDENKNKKILLEDLIPNVFTLQEKLIETSSQVFIKLSPLLDLQQTIQQLPISDIHIISLKNEVKELLIKLNTEKEKTNENPLIHCYNLESGQPEFSLHWLEEKQAPTPSYSQPKSHLYIPNASILKSGAFKLIACKYDLEKLHPNTHIYTSDEIIPDFPGRIFLTLDSSFNPSKSERKKYNIIIRNYPLKIEEIKKKYKLTEGGDKYLIFTKTQDKNLCILAEINKQP